MPLHASAVRRAALFLFAIGAAACFIGAEPSANPAAARGAAQNALAYGEIEGAMREGAVANGPPAYDAFCARAPSQCAPSARPTPGAYADLSADARSRLEAFNAEVNRTFKPVEDIAYYGVSDYWTLPDTAADCEDYVLYKRAALIEAGWPPEATLIAVVRSPRSGYHAVLVLRTRQGELVLDNLRDAVLDWRDAEYEWVIRQSTQDPSRWVAIEAPRALARL